MASGAEQDLAMARAVGRRNLNVTIGGAVLAAFAVADAILIGSSDEPPPPAAASSASTMDVLLAYGTGPLITLLVAWALGYVYIGRLRVARLSVAAVTSVALASVACGYVATGVSWMSGGPMLTRSQAAYDADGLGSALDVLSSAMAEGALIGLFGMVLTGWFTIPLAVVMAIWAVLSTNGEIARRTAVRPPDD